MTRKDLENLIVLNKIETIRTRLIGIREEMFVCINELANMEDGFQEIEIGYLDNAEELVNEANDKLVEATRNLLDEMTDKPLSHRT